MRTGDEPVHARSALRARLGLASFGLLVAIVGAIVFVATNHPPVAIGFLVLGLVAIVDFLAIRRHIRQGPHYQPGSDVPPYHPVDEPVDSGHAHHAPPTIRVRRRQYLALMAVCLGLFILAWGVVRFYSVTAAVVMTAIAAVIPPIAAIVANAGSDSDRAGGDERLPPDVP